MESPPLSRAALAAALDVYKTAWEQQDAELILSIFTEEAVYHERVLQGKLASLSPCSTPTSMARNPGIRRREDRVSS
jgi:hypothetical protein